MKVNLCIDGSYIMYKNVFILKSVKSMPDLKDALYNDLKRLSSVFPFDNIYFISDLPGSWRKMLYKEYKAKRTKDESIDWEYVYSVYDEFKEEIKELPNIKFLQQKGIEGDDFIAHIIRESNKEGYSNIIASSDKDLNQLLSYDLTNNYINIQCDYKFSDERLYLPQNYQLYLDKLSKNTNDNLFELDNSSDFVAYVENLISRTIVKEVNIEESIFMKIVMGDTGDNIPTVIKTKAGKVDDTGRGIGKTGAEKLYKNYKELYSDDIDFNGEKFLERLIDIVSYSKKLKNHVADDLIYENAKFNIKMMYLQPDYLPDDIYTKLDEQYTEVKNRKVEYTNENLEKKLESSGFFDEVKEDIPENFRIDETSDSVSSDNFDSNDYWEL